MSIVNQLKNNLINIPGWRTNRKIVVFESDDWGSIRMPSKNAYEGLLKKGIRVDKSLYDPLDCLEAREDLQNLFEVLQHTSKGSTHSKFTFNTVLGNPDFSKIEADKFENFHHEHFYNSYKKYHNEDNQDLWSKAINDKLIQPQFHAREHLNSVLWMKDLQNNHKETRIAFEFGFFGLKTKTSSKLQNHYLAAYRAENPNELKQIENITEEGLKMFEDTFGFKSKTFIGCNYTWPLELEPLLKKNDIETLQGQRGHIVPQPTKQGQVKIKHHFTGQKNVLNQCYTVRNVIFEPYMNGNEDWVDSALNQISIAFKWKKPAIISSHRINYVGGMSVKHRDDNLKKLSELLNKIKNRWSDVEFISSDELCQLTTKP